MTELLTAKEGRFLRVIAGFVACSISAIVLAGCGANTESTAPSDSKASCCASNEQQAAIASSSLPPSVDEAEDHVAVNGELLVPQAAMPESNETHAAAEMALASNTPVLMHASPSRLASTHSVEIVRAAMGEPVNESFGPDSDRYALAAETGSATEAAMTAEGIGTGMPVSYGSTPELANQALPPLRWKSSVGDLDCPNCTDVSTAEVGNPYRVHISLVEKQEGSGSASVSTTEVLSRLGDSKTHRFKLVPIYVDGIAPLNDADPKAIDLIARRPEFGSVSWGEASLDFRVLPEAKRCAQMIISVWDFGMRIAHDAFVITLPLPGRRNGPSNCYDPMSPSQRLAGPKLTSVSDVFQPGTPQQTVPKEDRISLYAFQLPLLKGDSYAFAVLAPADSEATTIRGWRLKSPLMRSFGEEAASFSRKAMKDRDKMRGAGPDVWLYEETAWFIREALFRGMGTDNESNARDAFVEIQDFVNARDGVKFVAQLYVPSSSEEPGLMFLPLRTMTGRNSGFFKEDFDLMSPLPGVAEESKSDCIADWKVILDGDMASGEVFNLLKNLKAEPWRDAALHTYDDTLAYFDPESISSEAENAALDRAAEPGGIGLIIAAHYGGGKLGLDNDDELPVNRMKRPFPPGSAAILAACQTAAPTEASGIINQLRDHQVDAFLASPLKVPTPYALSMVSYLIARIDKAYASGDTPTLGELYLGAMDDVGKEDTTNLELNNLGREYVMVGNSGRKLCKRLLPQEAEQ